MIHFIRNKNKTIVDIESLDNEIYCFVDIKQYSLYLLSLKDSDKTMFVQDISDLQEIGRCFLNIEREKTSYTLARDWCERICKKWALEYVED